MSAHTRAVPFERRTLSGRIGHGIGSFFRGIVGADSPVLDRVAVVTVIALILVAAVGWIFVPYNPYVAVPGEALLPPSIEHLLGTDDAGRDIFSRILAGAPSTLLLSLFVVVLTTTIGIVVASIAALSPRAVDQFIMRVCDVLLATPGMVLALGIAAALGSSLTSVAIALVVAGWPATTRFVRGILHETSGATYNEAARTAGVGRIRTLVRHTLPNSLDAVLVNASMEIAGTIVLVAGLSYLGVGAPPPSADWGSMVSQGKAYITTAWWVATFPGLAITVAGIGFGLLGDALRERLDPTLRRSR